MDAGVEHRRLGAARKSLDGRHGRQEEDRVLDERAAGLQDEAGAAPEAAKGDLQRAHDGPGEGWEDLLRGNARLRARVAVTVRKPPAEIENLPAHPVAPLEALHQGQPELHEVAEDPGVGKLRAQMDVEPRQLEGARRDEAPAGLLGQPRLEAEAELLPGRLRPPRRDADADPGDDPLAPGDLLQR